MSERRSYRKRSSLKETICKKILRWAGWNAEPLGGVELPKCVICIAPHTSNWDFVVGKLYYMAIGCTASFLIKKEWFVFPLNILFGWAGGVPVDRSKRMSVTDQMVERFNTHERFQLAITPEGTRKPVAEWKKGFYFIALRAKVPILVAFFDYKKKEVGVKSIFYPTGDVDKEVRMIREMYRDVTACHPENFVQI